MTSPRTENLSSTDDVADQFTEPTTTDGALALSVLESVTVLEAVVRAFHETLAKRRAADLHAVHGCMPCPAHPLSGWGMKNRPVRCGHVTAVSVANTTTLPW